jgi:hypothetical protein
MTPDRAEVDMSSEAIAGRLKEIGELWDLWNRLRKAKYLGPVEPNSSLKEGNEGPQETSKRNLWK